MELLKNACYHCDYKSEQKGWGTGKSITTCWCKNCGAFLYETIHDEYKDEFDTCYIDEVYRLLYTTEGRIELLAEAMKANDVEPPSCWTKPKK